MIQRFRSSGYLLALLATIIWSGNFIVARGLSQTYSAISLAFFRWLIAAIIITPFALPYIKRDFVALKKQWKLMVLLSLLGITLFNTFIYHAAHSTSALNLSLIAITAPFYVVILNRILFKEILSAKQIIGFVVLIAGLLLLLSKGDLAVLLQLQFNRGDMLMACAASIFGTYTVLVRKKDNSIGNLSFVAVTFILGVTLLFPLFIGEQLLYAPDITFSKVSVIQLLYIGIGPSVISFYLWNRAIVNIGSTRAATIYNTLPIYSALFAALILDEGILPIQIISSIVIVAGVFLVIRGGRKSTPA